MTWVLGLLTSVRPGVCNCTDVTLITPLPASGVLVYWCHIRCPYTCMFYITRWPSGLPWFFISWAPSHPCFARTALTCGGGGLFGALFVTHSYVWFVLGWFKFSQDLIVYEWRKQTCRQAGDGAVLMTNEGFCRNMGGLLLRGSVHVRLYKLVDLFLDSLHFGESQRGVHLKFVL